MKTLPKFEQAPDAAAPLSKHYKRQAYSERPENAIGVSFIPPKESREAVGQAGRRVSVAGAGWWAAFFRENGPEGGFPTRKDKQTAQYSG
jgi:hypothetical protein